MIKPAVVSNTKLFHYIQWIVGCSVVLIAIFAWVLSRDIAEQGIDEFSLFPLFGLLAFLLMWSHYVLGAVRRKMGLDKNNSSGLYWILSSGLVLVLLILHPLLLNYGLVSDGLGLPPASYEITYGARAIFLFLGSICLFVFLAFELRRFWHKKKWWRYIEHAQMVAITGIFIHALVLGRELTIVWFAVFWWICGLSLVGAWVYNYMYDKRLS